MKLCLAGTYVLDKSPQALLESKYLLESFYSIRDWQIPYFKQADLFILDSGAFTFLNNTKKGESVDWQEYIDRYADFVVKNNIGNFMEVDIDSVVGYENVKKLTKRLESITGRQCIPVWHKGRGLKEWERIIREYKYVAIGGIVTREIKSKDFKIFLPLLEMARRNNCKVHGLGFTNRTELGKYHFYSVDSTTWTGMCRFDHYPKYIPSAGTIKAINKNGKRVLKDKRTDAFLYSFREWIKFQRYVDIHY